MKVTSLAQRPDGVGDTHRLGQIEAAYSLTKDRHVRHKGCRHEDVCESVCVLM